MNDKNKYYISVGEPWDFNSPDGESIIRGVILKTLSATCLIFKANYLLDFEGSKGDILILSPRHSENSFNDLDKSSILITVNGGLLLKTYQNILTEEELVNSSKFVIIGSLRKG